MVSNQARATAFRTLVERRVRSLGSQSGLGIWASLGPVGAEVWVFGAGTGRAMVGLGQGLQGQGPQVDDPGRGRGSGGKAAGSGWFWLRLVLALVGAGRRSGRESLVSGRCAARAEGPWFRPGHWFWSGWGAASGREPGLLSGRGSGRGLGQWFWPGAGATRSGASVRALVRARFGPRFGAVAWAEVRDRRLRLGPGWRFWARSGVLLPGTVRGGGSGHGPWCCFRVRSGRWFRGGPEVGFGRTRAQSPRDRGPEAAWAPGLRCWLVALDQGAGIRLHTSRSPIRVRRLGLAATGSG